LTCPSSEELSLFRLAPCALVATGYGPRPGSQYEYQQVLPSHTQDGSNWITFKIRLLMSAAASGLSGHFEGTIVAPVAPALDMNQPNRWSKDEKKVYGGYCTSLSKWEQDENLTHAQIMSLISDLLLMKIHGCTTVAHMWKSLHDKFEGKPHLYAVDIRCRMMQKQLRTTTICALTWMRCSSCMSNWLVWGLHQHGETTP